MKKLLSIAFLLLATLSVYAQTDGISYQAVIIDPEVRQLPGFDVRGNILPNTTISMRFTIVNANNGEEYQEVQTTRTDQFGMVNLIIGKGKPTGAGTGDFTKVSWDGNAKSLRVEIDFEGSDNNFVDMNRQELTFVPYAFHRNITASGTLTVDDVTDLNGELTVQGPTNLNSSLNVNEDNPTKLSGTLNVVGNTILNKELNVSGATNLDSALNINNQSSAHFSGKIITEDSAIFNGPSAFKAGTGFTDISVSGQSNLNGQVTVDAVIDNKGKDGEYDKYPLLVEGSHQGIAIKMKETRSSNNNYVSFWDESGENGKPRLWGRIEGQTPGELLADPEYLAEIGFKGSDIFLYGVEVAIGIAESIQGGAKVVASSTSTTACVGVGACFTAPIPSLIIESGTHLILKIANGLLIVANLGVKLADLGVFVGLKNGQIGVSYQSGARDYAEWLPKENPSEIFSAGEVVGVKNGVVTKNTWGVEKIMIVSTKPIVLGNMPQQENEKGYVKIAFMGQVPVKVIGKVQPGDYILPSELGGGFAKAVHPDDMLTRDYKKVAGVAWSVLAGISENISLVNAAIGINTNDLSDVVHKQQVELTTLKESYNVLLKQITASNTALSRLVPGYSETIGFKGDTSILETGKNKLIPDQKVNKDQVISHNEEDVVYFEISREQIESAIEVAREQYVSMLNDGQMKKIFLSDNDNAAKDLEKRVLIPIEDHPFWQRIDSDPGYKEEIIQYVQSIIEKSIHTHRKYANKFSHLKMKE